MQDKSSKKAPISLCMICKNDEQSIEATLKCFRPFVNEICVVDTGSTDSTPEIVKKYADKYIRYTECNDAEGRIESFADARNKSLELASNQYVMWVDSDDIVEGLEHLNDLIREAEKEKISNIDCIGWMFKYEYAYSPDGQCICEHYRERLFSDKSSVVVVNPVHEVFVPKDDKKIHFITSDKIVWKHQRQYISKPVEGNRNLRILKKYVEKMGDSDARQLYYLGLEYFNANDFDMATKMLSRYIELSGWDDEKCMAALKMVEICEKKADYKEGLKWAFKAVETKEQWGEGYFALAKMFYFLANAGTDERRNWERCLYFARLGLQLPETKTLLFVNPFDREYSIHLYMNIALNKLGDVRGALNSVNKGLEKVPNDPMLLNNKKVYQSFLQVNDAMGSVDILNDMGELPEGGKDVINSILRNKTLPAIAVESDVSYFDNKFPVAFTSPAENVWKIPNSYDFNSYPIKMTDEQLQSVVILVWKQYMLHDEVLSAISFLENAPYNVRHSAATLKALDETKSCLSWIQADDDFQKVNAPDVPDEVGTPLPHPPCGAEADRFHLMADHLAPQSSLVDFGSMDGCFTNRFGLLGHKPVGLDACKQSVNVANRKAAEFNTGARHICTYFDQATAHIGDAKFDYATSSDTYEHLVDPVKDMLIPARQMLKPDGKFLLCTPHGAWMRGRYLEWAHPWNWAREGKGWLEPSPRAHLIAPTVWSVTEHFRKAGYWVKDCYVSHGSAPDVPGQGNVFAEAYLNPPQNHDPLDIVFYAGDGLERWNPLTVKKTGIGGSEMMLISQAKRFAAMGHKVRVFNSCGKDGEGVFDGVEYCETSKYQNLKCDVLIVSRRADALDDAYKVKAKLKLLWVHDVYALNATNERLLKADRILALSEWHKQNLINHHHISPEQVVVTRNGIDLSRFSKPVTKNQYKCVNSSSPDRSWPVLLEVWPEIKRRVPQAELHLYYGFTNWKISARHDSGQLELIRNLEEKISQLSGLGVVFHDRIDQDLLAEELLSAGVWLYSTWFEETSCQLKGTLISTKNGMKPIEEIQVGDLVLTHKGRFRPVTELIRKKYKGKLYSIKRRKNFNPIVLTESHPLLTATFHKRSDAKGNRVHSLANKKVNWEGPENLSVNKNYLLSPKIGLGSLSNLRFSDYIDLPVVDGKIGPKIKCRDNFKYIDNDIEITDELMYMLGLFAAEGCSTAKRGKQKARYTTITFAMHLKEMAKAERVVRFFGGGAIKQTSENGIIVSVYHSVWAKFLASQIGTGIKKRIPPFVWDCSKEHQNAFLLGMFEGDGCTRSTNDHNNAHKRYKFASYTSISPSLAYGFAQLLANQGIYSSMSFSAERRAYTLDWSVDSKCPQHIELDEGFATRITDIKCDMYDGDVYNFEVEDDHSYVTDRTIVHNCITAMEMQAAGVRMVTSNIAALKETVGSRGVLLDGDWTSPEYKKSFIENAVAALTAPGNSDRERLQQYAVEHFSLDDLAHDWISMIRNLLVDLKTHPIVPYMPTVPYC